jgi:class 3 adenylate cyclase
MGFRIGINLGDVMVEGERLYGDGVNIAARMEGLAQAGAVCLSGTAHDHVENKLPAQMSPVASGTLDAIRGCHFISHRTPSGHVYVPTSPCDPRRQLGAFHL